jgi:hypothetical protein
VYFIDATADNVDDKAANALWSWRRDFPWFHYQSNGPRNNMSQFISLVSGSNLRIGGQLESCTAEMEVSMPFELDGRLVELIDTPGFDDTTMCDTDILNMIAAYLCDS